MPHRDLQARIEASFAQQGLMRVIEAHIAEERTFRDFFRAHHVETKVS